MIELSEVKKTYISERGTVHALNGITLTIKRGEFVSFMGTSGCGKSTLLNIIGCMDTLTEGSYLLNREDVQKLNGKQKAHARSHTFGFVFQSFHLVPEMTVLENVMLPLRYSSQPKKTHRQTAKDVLAVLGIEALEKERPARLSGGEQQRVAIARAMVASPEVMLCDEPTGNLDTTTGHSIMDVLCDLHSEMGKTIILVTHDVKVAGYAQRILEMRDGKIISAIM